MKRNQLAINSVSTQDADLETRLAAYHAAGFQYVEFALHHVKHYLQQGHTLAEARRLLEAYELKCIGGFETGVNCFGEGDARAQNHAAVVANAELLAELGGRCLVVGTDGPSQPVEDPLGEMAGVFAELADKIRDTGVILCIEFNWSPLVKSLRAAAEIARRANHPNVGVLFDLAHYYCTPTKFDQINAANVPFIKHVHIDDMRDKPPELSNCNSDRVLPGQGCLDVAAIITALEGHGYRGYFAIEMFNDELWAMPTEQAARLMYESLLPFVDD